ncbi:MAG: hypothetical protein QOJ80_74 [Mycobacterium sp.]|jgi:hypothetical protein|nr:hypothetical protein [Mycobacterium sp.]
MTGANAIRVYDLAVDLLAKTAQEIGAPTLGELATPPVGELTGSNGTGGLAFRHEAWT